MSDQIPTASEFLKSPATGSYRPTAYGGYLWRSSILPDNTWFSWQDVEAMRRDPQVRFCLAIRRAPIYQATWKVQSNDRRVSQFVDVTLKRVWKRAIRKIMHHEEWGIHAGEISYEYLDGLIQFDQLDEFHPTDVRPLEFSRPPRKGEFAGIEVRGIKTTESDSQNRVRFFAPHAWWFSGHSEYGLWYGWPVLAGAWVPWAEKRGRHGAIDSRRLWYHKCAFRGPRIRYPIGTTKFGTDIKDNLEIAREIGEKVANGYASFWPNNRDANAEFQWNIEEPQSNPDQTGLRDYPKDLDREIMIGMGIPPELVEAASVGSGYSGRAIPAQMFFTSMDETISLLMDTINRLIVEPLVAVNFGEQRYEIQPDSLAKMVAAEPRQAGNLINTQAEPGDGFQLSHAEKQIRKRIRKLAAKKFPELGGVQLGWSAARSKTGSIKAVGVGQDQGKTLYGAEAQAALAAKPEAKSFAFAVTDQEIGDIPELDTPEKQAEAKSQARRIYDVVASYITEAGLKSFAFVTGDLIPNADDYGNIFMSKDRYGVDHDPALAITGGLLPAPVFAKLAGKVIHKALIWVKSKIKGATLSDDRVEQTATVIAEIFSKIYANAERPEQPPTAEEVAQLIRKRTRSAKLSAAHAPTGGVSVGGQQFKGGQFIPAEVMAQATAEERAAVKGAAEPMRKTSAEAEAIYDRIDQVKSRMEPIRQSAQRVAALSGSPFEKLWDKVKEAESPLAVVQGIYDGVEKELDEAVIDLAVELEDPKAEAKIKKIGEKAEAKLARIFSDYESSLEKVSDLREELKEIESEEFDPSDYDLEEPQEPNLDEPEKPDEPTKPGEGADEDDLDDYEAELEQYQSDLEQYQEDLDEYNTAMAEYGKAVSQYERALAKAEADFEKQLEKKTAPILKKLDKAEDELFDATFDFEDRVSEVIDEAKESIDTIIEPILESLQDELDEAETDLEFADDADPEEEDDVEEEEEEPEEEEEEPDVEDDDEDDEEDDEDDEDLA